LTRSPGMFVSKVAARMRAIFHPVLNYCRIS